MTVSIVPQKPITRQFLSAFSSPVRCHDIHCRVCGRPMRLLAGPGDNLSRLVLLRSAGCLCQLPTRTLTALLHRRAWGLRDYQAQRAQTLAALGFAAFVATETALAYPLPERLKADIGTILTFRRRQEAAEAKAAVEPVEPGRETEREELRRAA